MIGTPISKTCEKSLVHRGKIASIGQYYHVVFDDGDGNSHLANLPLSPSHYSLSHTLSSPPHAFTPEEDLSEDEALTCAKEYEQKFGAQHSSTSALRRRQREKYENAGTYIYLYYWLVYVLVAPSTYVRIYLHNYMSIML